MHEMSLTQNIIEIVEESARVHDATKVLKITLSVGELSDVVIDAMRFCFEAITPGTMLEGAQIEMNPVEARARCQMCGTEFHPDPLDFTCPGCGNPFTEVFQGNELSIASIEVEDPEPSAGPAPQRPDAEREATTPKKGGPG